MTYAEGQADERYLSRAGRAVEFRVARADDLPLLRDLFAGLSEESRRLRFFAATRIVNEALLGRMLSGDATGGVCLLGFDVASGRLLAVAQYVPDGCTAEVAFAVDDKAHGEGIATEMLRRLIERATCDGLSGLTALVLGENIDMLNIFGESGWPTTMKCTAGVYQVVIDLTAR